MPWRERAPTSQPRVWLGDGGAPVATGAHDGVVAGRGVGIGWRRAAAIAVVALVAVSTAGADGRPPGHTRTLWVPDLPAALTVDGALDEPAWARAAVATNFWVSAAARAPREATEVRVLVSDRTLHVAFLCYESQPGAIRTSKGEAPPGQRDDDHVTVEIDARHDHERIARFSVNAKGGRSELLPGRAPTFEVKRGWSAAARRVRDGWTAEIAVPLALVGLAGPPERIGVNFLRYQSRTGELSRWADVTPAGLATEAGHLDFDVAGVTVAAVHPQAASQAAGPPPPPPPPPERPAPPEPPAPRLTPIDLASARPEPPAPPLTPLDLASVPPEPSAPAAVTAEPAIDLNAMPPLPGRQNRSRPAMPPAASARPYPASATNPPADPLAAVRGRAGFQPPVASGLDVDPGESTYRLQRGDVLELKHFSNPELNVVLPIRPDGRISLELIGDVEVAGLTPVALQDHLNRRYTPFLRRPDVSVIVKEFGGNRIYVGGEVNSPGIIRTTGNLTLLQAILEAGGFRRSAELKSVVVLRNQGTDQPEFLTVNLKDTLEKPGANHDVVLQPYDIVFLPRTRVTKVGEFMDSYINQIIPVPLSLGLTYAFDRLLR